MDLPKHFRLHSENNDHFVIHDSRVNKTFPVAKKVLHPATQIRIMKMQKFDEGGDVVDTPDYATMPVSDIQPQTLAGPQTAFEEQFPNAEKNVSDWFNPPPDQGTAQAGPPPQMAPEAQAEPDAPQIQMQAAPQGAPQGQSTIPQPQGLPTPQTLSGIESGYGRALQEETKGQIEQNKQMAEAQDKYNQLMQDKMATYEASMKNYQGQYDKMMDDVATDKIDPKQYWSEKSTGAKVGAAFALLLGGIGQGLSHSNSNAAMDVINSQINQNIDAQKANLGKKQSLLSDNLRMQGNLTAAENATRLQYSAMLQGQLASVAAKTNSPIIQARAQEKLLELRHRDLPLMQSLAQSESQQQLRRQLSDPKADLSQVDPAQLVQHLVPEHLQPKAYEEIKNAQNVAQNGPKIMDAFDKAAAQVKVPGWERSGSMALHQLMLPNFKTIDGTVRQAAMDESFNNTTPSSFDGPDKTATKRKALQDWLISESSAPISKGNHIDLERFKSTSTDPYMRLNPQQKQYASWAKQNPNDPRAPMVMNKLGLK